MSPKKSKNQDVKASLYVLFFPICSAALRNRAVDGQGSSPDTSVVQKVLAGSIYDFMPVFVIRSLMSKEDTTFFWECS